MAEQEKDFWDKLGVILRPVGGLMTALAIAVFGFLSSSFLDRRQAIETNTRLYSELMSNREQAESALRKDMFNSIIDSFLKPNATSLNTQVLNLELLAYNFHESLNLKPLFSDLKKTISERLTRFAAPDSVTRHQDYLKRLESVAKEITRKQMIVLEGVGQKRDWSADLTSQDFPISLEPVTLELDSLERIFRVDVLEIDTLKKELRIDLMIETPDPDVGRQTKNATFRLGFYDFPMIDNTRLSNDQRCSVVLNRFTGESAEITLVLFPGAYASLKEKPYYGEVIDNVLKASKRFGK